MKNKFLKITIILSLILMYSIKCHSICNDSIHKNNKYRVHYKFGISGMYYYQSPCDIRTDLGYIKFISNNTFGINLSHDLYLLRKLNVSISFEYAGNFSKVENNNYLDKRITNVKTSSFFLSIPVRVNYSIITYKKINLIVGMGALFTNTQSLNIKGNMNYNGTDAPINYHKRLEFRNYINSSYWDVYESNCIGIEYYIRRHLSVRLSLNFNFSSNKLFLFGTNLGIIF